MGWSDDTFVAYDCESTGVDTETARLVTANITQIHVPSGTVDSVGWLADPGVEIPAGATAVHGITTEHAREHGRPAAEVAAEVSKHLADIAARRWPIVIYNAPYDVTVLDRECRRYGLPTLHDLAEAEPLFVDPLVIDKAQDRYRRGSRKLVDVCAHYGVTLDEQDAHTSAGDSIAAARLAWVMARRFPEMADLVALQGMQAAWYREQAESFREYLIRRKRQDGASPEETASVSVPVDWPLRPYTDEAVA